jgi:hypothetical protein
VAEAACRPCPVVGECAGPALAAAELRGVRVRGGVFAATKP